MTKILSVYRGDDRVEIKHPCGDVIITDLPPDNGGRGRNFSPTDLVASAVASCILTIMSKFAMRHGIDITGTSIEIEKHMSDNPRRIKKLCGIIKFSDTVPESEKNRLLTVVKNCPVSHSLHPDIEISFEYK